MAARNPPCLPPAARFSPHIHINGIERFGSFAKRILHDYRGVSKYNFPVYRKEAEYRFNHGDDGPFKLFMSICFG